MSAARPDNPLAAYVTVTAAYWAFMLTDGALRMLVLLHFHALGFSPVQLAYLFVLYEIAGIVTNLTAGWIAARVGLSTTLYAGMILQILALIALAFLDPGWTLWASVAFVMAVQGVSGVAKDLAKMSSKSAVKLLAPAEEAGALFRWVALLTGSKNTVKGIGFFIGAALLSVAGFEASVIGMAVILAVILVAVAALMPAGLPVGSKGAKFSEVFSQDTAINRLSAARMFLFGARDIWFVVGIPIYFYSVLSDGSEGSNQTAFFKIGAFMALWVIGYGVIQAVAPKLLRAGDKSITDIAKMARLWVGVLILIPTVLALASFGADGPAGWLTATLIAGLLLFGVVFALNSALHSYLILAFSKSERVTMDVGFYYMANAAGRLMGTLVSGISYQLGGLTLCLGMSALAAALSWFFASRMVEAADTREPLATDPARN